MRTRALVVAVVLAALGFPAWAQAPAPPSCEDTLRTVRILAEQYAASRQRTEIEAAQSLAGLLKQIDALRAQVQALEAEKKAKTEPAKEGK